MNSVEGGSLFLKSFTESCVQEAIRQEGLKKYEERVRKAKAFGDILLDIIVLPFKILLLALKVIFWMLFYIYVWLATFSFIFVLVMTSGIIVYVVYEDIHFGTCPLVRTEQDYVDVYYVWLVDMMTPLVKNSQFLKRLYEHWEFGKSRTSPLYKELTKHVQEKPYNKSDIPIGPPGVGGCRAG